MPNAFEQYTSVLKGGTTPVSGGAGGSSFDSYISGAGVKAVKPQQQPQTTTPSPIQVQPVTPAKTGILNRLKTGFQSGGIGGAISSLLPSIQPPEVVAQNMKTFVEQPNLASYATKEQITKFANFVKNPIDTYIKTAQNEILAQPNFDKTIMGKLMLGGQKIVENVFEANPTIRGLAKGSASMYLNSSEEINKLYDKQLTEPTDAVGRTLYKMGEIPATVFSYLLGGEALKALKFGRATLPILFATLGQTSASYQSTIKQRIEKMPVDLLAGYFFGAMPETQVTGLKDVLSPQVLKNMGGVGSVVGVQTFIDNLIYGMSPKDAAKAVPQAITVAMLFYATALSVGVIDQSTKSKISMGVDTYTPSDLKDMVYNSGKQNTPIGKRLINYSNSAETLGKDLRINYLEIQKSFLADTLKLKTPQGTALKVEFVDRVSQPQITTPSGEVTPTKETRVPTIIPPKPPQGTQVSPVTPVIVRQNFKVAGLPPEVTGSLVTVRPDGTASYNLEVAQDSRGQGIGAEAVKTIENAILEKGITQVELPVKPESVGFFEKQGYKVVGEESKGIVPMEKTLTTEEQDNDVYKQVIKNGGITISLGGKQPTEGIAFSPFKGLETIIDENNFTAEDVTKFKKAHLKELSIPGNNIGIWKDGGKFYLDISRVGDYTPKTLQEAMDNQQIAAFDLKSLVTGENGDIPLGKMENGVYNPTYEAINHPYLNKGKNRSTVVPGTTNKPVKVSTGGEVSKTTTVKTPRKTNPSKVSVKNTQKITKAKIEPKKTVKKTVKKSVKSKKSVKKLTIKEQQDQIIREARMGSSPMTNPEVEQYSDVITKAIRVYNLNKAKGNDDISTITKKVPELDSALEALRDAGYEISTMDELVSMKKRSQGFSGDLGFNPKNLENLDSPVVSKEVGKIIKRSEIARQLSEKLNVPIRTGKFRRSALGLFKTQQKVVRIKGGGKSGGLPTKFHEVAHFIDSNLNLSRNINIVERKALMEEYAYTYEGKPKLQQQEAFAEFIRFRMTGQEERANRLGPKFSKYFDSL